MSPLPIRPPLSPMLARREETLPIGPPGAWRYEIKLDGIRALLFRDGGSVVLQSRQGNPLTGFFPELVAAALVHLPARVVLDGEVVVTDSAGTSFRAAMSRLGVSAERAERLAGERPALLVAFDLLARGEQSLMGAPFAERRALLETTLPSGSWHLAASLGLAAPPTEAPSPIQVMPQTADPGLASRWFSGLGAAGVEGIVAKRARLAYRPGKRAMVKVKRPLAGGR